MLRISVLLAFAVLCSSVFAQVPVLEKKNYNYSEWTKGRFSEAVTVSGPGKSFLRSASSRGPACWSKWT